MLIISLILLMLLIAGTIIGMLIIRRKREKSGFDEKNHLYNKIKNYRLNKMLQYLGVNIDDYIYKLPEEQVLTHIAQCVSCPDTETCDQHLRDGKYVENMEFCPNYPSLIACSKALSATKRARS